MEDFQDILDFELKLSKLTLSKIEPCIYLSIYIYIICIISIEVYIIITFVTYAFLFTFKKK